MADDEITGSIWTEYSIIRNLVMLTDVAFSTENVRGVVSVYGIGFPIMPQD